MDKILNKSNLETIADIIEEEHTFIENSLAEIKSAIPVGTIIPWAGNVAGKNGFVPKGWLICDGSAHPKKNFLELYAVIGDTYGTADTYMFRVPDLSGLFLEGANSNTGTKKEAGVPNISGNFALYTRANNGHGANVQLYGTNSSLFTKTTSFKGINRYSDYDNQNGNVSGYEGIKFDASKANSTYGKSDTVQPASLCMQYLIKY